MCFIKINYIFLFHDPHGIQDQEADQEIETIFLFSATLIRQTSNCHFHEFEYKAEFFKSLG